MQKPSKSFLKGLVILLSISLTACSDDKSEDLENKQAAFKKHYQSQIDNFENKGYTLQFDSDKYKDLTMSGTHVDGVVNIREIEAPILTWSISCDSYSCALRWRTGERNESKVFGIKLKVSDMKSVAKMLKGVGQNPSQFSDTNVQSYAYIYNEYSIYERFKNEYSHFSVNDFGQLTIRPKKEEVKKSFVSFSSHESLKMGEIIEDYFRILTQYNQFENTKRRLFKNLLS